MKQFFAASTPGPIRIQSIGAMRNCCSQRQLQSQTLIEDLIKQ